MTLQSLLDEYNLTDDDIRWSLSLRMAESFAVQLDDDGPEAIARIIWSGELEDRLYDMLDRWIRERGESLSRGVLDEGHLRDELAGMDADRIRRRRS